MLFVSTRGSASPRTLNQLLVCGTAEDGGLYVPQKWPVVNADELGRIGELAYHQIVSRVLRLFGGDSWTGHNYEKIIENTFSKFEHPSGPPIVKLDDNLWSLELFHGPTFAFKDYALQPLASLIDHKLKIENDHATILCATSGDTGAATAHAFSGFPNIRTIILYPEGRVSDVQRKQMTTLDAENVLVFSVRGDFDNCQNIVKQLYQSNQANKHRFAAANSINFVRILLQTAYYLYTSYAVKSRTGELANFIVPTGNFGNVYSAHIAKKLGAPIRNLIVSSNENDVLPRLLSTGRMFKRPTYSTISPSMDIQVSSNFERMLWLLSNNDHSRTALLQQQLETEGEYQLNENELIALSDQIDAVRCSKDQALTTMRDVSQRYNKTICPHSASAFYVANEKFNQLSGTTVVVETAHPAKFPSASQMALGTLPSIPENLKAVTCKQEKFTTIDPDIATVSKAIEEKFG